MLDGLCTIHFREMAFVRIFCLSADLLSYLYRPLEGSFSVSLKFMVAVYFASLDNLHKHCILLRYDASPGANTRFFYDLQSIIHKYPSENFRCPGVSTSIVHIDGSQYVISSRS